MNPEKELTMRYLILINSDESQNLSDAQRQDVMTAYRAYTQDLQKAGVMLAGDALYPTAKGGARIKISGGKRAVTDGPFSEAKEVIGGYYLIQVKSREEAVEWASRCPGASNAGVEVREVVEM
jgi:hypothetical protein